MDTYYAWRITEPKVINDMVTGWKTMTRKAQIKGDKKKERMMRQRNSAPNDVINQQLRRKAIENQ
jgi:hypothetical protein